MLYEHIVNLEKSTLNDQSQNIFQENYFILKNKQLEELD